jgi:hypothetical protein
MITRLIQRKNSWSRMKILPDMFKYVCWQLQTHAAFLDLVWGFGHRTASYDQTFTALYSSVPSQNHPVGKC